MIELHSLSGETRRTSERVGRGISAGRGKTAGRGTKGQKSRSGYNLPRRFEGGQSSLIQRLPKKRGFKHYGAKPVALDVELINRYFNDGEIVSTKSLMAVGLLKDYPKAGVKIIGNSKLVKSVSFQGIIFSQKVEDQAFENAADTKIEKPAKEEKTAKKETAESAAKEKPAKREIKSAAKK
jgi:large subunit ribosomal protein L15